MSDGYLSITLPSRCKPYPDVNPADIKIRPYRGKDELLLSEITIDNLDKKYLMVLEQVMKGINPSRLTLGDRLYIMITEYINSYSNTVDIEFMCGSCFTSNTAAVDLSNLDVITLPDDYKEPVPVLLPSGKTVNMKLLSITDEIDCRQYELQTQESGTLFRLAKSWVDNRDVLARLKDLEEFDAKDTREMRKFAITYAHGPDMRAPAKCAKCGEVNELSIPFRFDFIFSKY